LFFSSLCVFALPAFFFLLVRPRAICASPTCFCFPDLLLLPRPARASPRHLYCPVLPVLSRAIKLLPGAGHIATTVPEIRKALYRRAWQAVRPAARSVLRDAAQKLLQACDSPGTANLRGRKHCAGKYFRPVFLPSHTARRKAVRRHGRLVPGSSKNELAAAMWVTAQSPKCLNCETPPQTVVCEANGRPRAGATRIAVVRDTGRSVPGATGVRDSPRSNGTG
jgi:hypothetical protein